jgi:type I restriction enzyme S subunit
VAYETREYTNEAGLANSAARILPAGTVVLSRTASVGFVTVMGRPMATSQDFVNWVCGPDLDPWFLAYLFIASRTYIRSLASGAIHSTVYVPTAEAFRVCVPPLDEQKRIAARLGEQLAELDRIANRLSEQRDAIAALPSVLLRQAFSGTL